MNSPDIHMDDTGDRRLIAGEIIGHRAWRLSGSWAHPRLESLGRHVIWPIDRWLTAGEHYGHPAPEEGCTCGIHAARSRAHLFEMEYDAGSLEDWTLTNPFRATVVTGEVALAGKVIPGSQGWLAEKARVYRIYVPHAEWRRGKILARAYNVPYILHNPADPEEAPPCAT